jgi:hypothetical protein
MTPSAYTIDVKLSASEFQKIGRFACLWAGIEHSIGNCLRVILEMEPEQATVMVFPLNLDMRMARISELTRLNIMTSYQLALFAELKPLIKGMQYLRNTTLHGIVMNPNENDAFFHLRSKSRIMSKEELFSCEELINYATQVTQAFRISLGDTGNRGHTYALPDRPQIPSFLPADCRALPKEDTEVLRGQPKASPS